MSLTEQLAEALGAAGATERHGAAVALAKLYASEIDREPALLDKLGPKLLATLDQLLMTPKAMALRGIEEDDDQEDNPVDDIRARRANRATALDASPR